MTDAKNAFELALENASTIPPMYELKAEMAKEQRNSTNWSLYKCRAATWREAIEYFSIAFDEYLEEQKNAENKA